MSKALLYKVTIGVLLIALGVVSIYIITPPNKTQAGFGISSLDVFSSYTRWPGSDAFNSTDTMAQTLFQLASGPTAQSSSLSDVNGDGLTDILKHETCGQAGSQCRFAVFLNKGNLMYDLAYKCVVYYNNSGTPTYYGDCAGII